MTRDDPRHGTWAGYNLGCRDRCCRSAAYAYQKRRAYDAARGRARKVPAVGLHRRIQALNCLGWSNWAISRRAGVHREQIRQWLLQTTVLRTSYDKVAAVYEELSMTLPPTDTPHQRMDVTRTRNRARRNGWAPPLAYDDIDNPNERPKVGRMRDVRGRGEVDQSVVTRVLAGETLTTTAAEKAEILRRWSASGRSATAFAAAHGWKAERYWRAAS